VRHLAEFRSQILSCHSWVEPFNRGILKRQIGTPVPPWI
jgi:hypothetical protein